jgi:putative phosphoesterase
MTRIGLLSDTHSYLDEKVFSYFEACDEIWHAGDIGNLDLADRLAAFKPLRAVYGNIDGHDVRKVHPKNQRFFSENLDVWITHIGGYPGHYDKDVQAAIKQNPPDLFISGHSHILKVMRDPKLKNMLHINPGAAGINGFHKVKTLVRFTVNGKSIQDLQVIELGTKG